MKITKYPQSCLLVETNGKKILIDPGAIKYEDQFLSAWQQADVIFITHRHFDHLHKDIVPQLTAPIYSTAEVQAAFPNLQINVVKDGGVIDLGDGVKVEVVKAVHGYTPLLKKGGEVLENVGYIVDDGTTRLYQASDTICFPNDYKADIVALPVMGYGLTMASFEAALVAKDMEARLALPIHMDNDVYPCDLSQIQANFTKQGVNYQILGIGESIEV